MTRIIITGANGKMGKVLQSIIANRENCEIVAGVDLNTADNGVFPI
ncbi:MAG: 4-hydroxy-tetrahydrodipicolinate reductase, partial [Eubacterium sp.]|nr:4-hydroxy-tetrahydrodipicolinate reductase [Eubacterium sp.]